MDNIEQLRNEMTAAKRAFAERGKALLHQTFKDFFAANPEVTSVVWQQYTPWFNDGETCEFGVHEPHFFGPLEERNGVDDSVDVPYKIKQQTERQYKDLGTTKQERGWDGRIYDRPVYGYVDAERKATERETALLDACEAVQAVVQGLEDVLQELFGDHVEVTATASGFDTAGYHHE